MLFIVIRTKSASDSQKALEVSLGVTRFVQFTISSRWNMISDRTLSIESLELG